MVAAGNGEGENPKNCNAEAKIFPGEDGADLQGYELTEADRLLDSVYGNHAHANNGTHLNGGILDDRKWQKRWKKVVQVSSHWFKVPQGRTEQRFLSLLTEEVKGVRERKWNSERPLVFVVVVLQTDSGVKRLKDIRAKIEGQMDLWE